MSEEPRRKLRFSDCLTRKEIAIVVLMALATATATGVLILAVRRILQILETTAVEGVTDLLLFPLAVLAGATVVFAILRGAEFAVSETISFNATHRLRMDLYNHMTGMAPDQIRHRSRGSLILRLTGDLTMLRTWLARGFSRGLVAVFSLLACLGVVAYFSLLLVGVITATFLGFAIVSTLVGRRLQEWTKAVRRRRSRLTSNIDEQVHALAVVQVFGRTAGETQRLSRQSEHMTEALSREARLRGMLRGVSDFAGWTAVVISLWVGTRLLLNGDIDLASLFVTLLAIRLMHGYVRQLANSHEYWRRAQISRSKLEDFLNSSSRTPSHVEQEPLRHRRAPICFDNVVLAGGSTPFSARVDAGRHVALVGPSGGGKSTVLGLVARLADPESGTVAIGDQDLATCQLDTIYRRVGMVSPQLPLMRGTLRRNLTYRNPSATDEDVQALLDSCHLNDLVNELPGGLDFWLTEGGANLPGGASQRIRFARALLGSPPILLLDQAMDGLDDDTRTVFRSVIARYAGTILSVSENADDLAIADTVWRVERGTVVEEIAASQYLRDRQPAMPAFLRLASVA
ncbi:ABC transporter ATP-binding protein/permease [Qipengyuania sp. 6B39]|uniref:ABC transporter ATP-binding protein n=1 Tax=Qipengyuania proteolytica TaxID=2867239 RepID=UPI001C89787C|nr:ABC transporter ATP-binding protein [Qipengyuania proteolytica]MBX7495113.1 ABC transporter ATP-binding protein/permease [Qipengyuania proteolytica]